MDARILPLDFVYLSVVVTVQKILIHGLTQMKHGKMQTTQALGSIYGRLGINTFNSRLR